MTGPSNLKPSEVLARAADLIEPEGAWTRGAAARDRIGLAMGVGGACGPNAVCWCLMGALYRSGMAAAEKGETAFVRRAIGSKTGIGDWNDRPSRTQAEVVKALRDAADLARAEGC